MNVLRDTAVVSLRNKNILVLVEQLRVTRDRQQFGEVTMTDVAQAEAALAQARSDYAGAQSSLENSIADYHQVIGEDPKRLEPARTLEHMLPKSRKRRSRSRWSSIPASSRRCIKWTPPSPP